MSFDFTVAVVPNNIDINSELQYIKSALLYADSITLISPIAYLYTLILDEKNLHDERPALELLKLIAPFIKATHEDVYTELSRLIRIISPFVYGKNRSAPFKMKLQYRKLLFDFVKDASITIEESIGRPQCLELNQLLTTQKVNLRSFNHMISDVDEFTPEYFEMLTEAIQTSYPIFDETSNDLMKAAVQARVINLSEFDRKKIQHAGVSDNILQKLPDFSDASITEIIDIKTELAAPLVRFRSQMLRFTDEIQSCPWDNNFEFECSQLYAKKISPALLEIDELTKESGFLKNLGRNIIVDSNFMKSAGGLMISIAAAGVVSAYTEVVSSGTAIGATALAWTAEKIAKAYITMQESKDEIIKKDLYFYYQAGNLLKK